MNSTLIELVGYLGSILVVVSMLMTSVVKLRVINTVGGLIFSVYAFIIQSYPTAFMNLILVIINLYNLAKLTHKEKNFDLLAGKDCAGYIRYLLDHYLQDILVYFPDFKYDPQAQPDAMMVLLSTNPAGILLGKHLEDGTFEVAIDYAVPTYRDCSVGHFLYAHAAEHGIRRLVYRQPLSDKHAAYLSKMGFEPKDGTQQKLLS